MLQFTLFTKRSHKNMIYLFQYPHIFEYIDNLENIDQLFYFACIRDYTKILDILWKKRNPTLFYYIDINFEYIFDLCCEKNNISVVRWLWNINRTFLHKKCNYSSAFRKCCKYQSNQVAIFLLNKIRYNRHEHVDVDSFYDWIHQADDEFFIVCCRSGNLEIAKLLWKLGEISSQKINIHIFDELAFRICCKEGHLDFAKWLWKIGENSSQKININIRNETPFTDACTNGHLKIAKWLLSIDENIIKSQYVNQDVFTECCTNGYVNTAKWLFEQIKKYDPNKINIHQDNEYIFRLCCENGYLQTIRWLWEASNKTINIHAKHDDAFVTSCYSNHYYTAKWIYHMCKGFMYLDYQSIFNDAIRHHPTKKIANLIWKICEHSNHPLSKEYSNLVKTCFGNDLYITKNIWKSSLNLGKPIHIDLYDYSVILDCCRHGNIRYVNWFFNIVQKTKVFRITDLPLTDMFNICCYHEHFNMAKYLFIKAIKLNVPINFDNIDYDIFVKNCINGNFHIFEWLFLIIGNKKEIVSQYDNYLLFRLACKFGHFDIAKLLVKTSNIDIHAENEDAFRMACKNNHILIVEWLWKISNKNINIHTNDNDVFYQCCVNGNLTIAQFLWKIKKEHINIHFDDEKLFRSSTKSGNLRMSQWLWNISDKKINIYSRNNYAFKKSCKKHHFHVAKWLWDIDQQQEKRFCNIWVGENDFIKYISYM